MPDDHPFGVKLGTSLVRIMESCNNITFWLAMHYYARICFKTTLVPFLDTVLIEVRINYTLKFKTGLKSIMGILIFLKVYPRLVES